MRHHAGILAWFVSCATMVGVGLWPAGPFAAATAAAGPLAPLGPAQAACPSATGPLGRQATAAAVGAGPGAMPLLLPVGGATYLQVARRPTPHVAALVSSDATGRVLWRVPMPASVSAAAVTALGAVAIVSERRGASLAMVRVNAAGRAAAGPVLPWPATAPAPALTPDGQGGVLVSASTANLPLALSGLGFDPAPLVDLGPTLRVVWRLGGAAGAVVATGAGTVVSALRSGRAGQVVSLMGVNAQSGALRWKVALSPGFAPRTAAFAVAGSDLVWAFTGPGGGGIAGALDLRRGHALWQAQTRLPVWVADGASVAAGASPWDAPARLTVRTAATGRIEWQGGAGTPVAVLGQRLLVETPAAPKRPSVFAWWSGPWSHPAYAAVRPAVPVSPGGLSLYCGGGGAMLWGPWQAGVLWTASAGSGPAGQNH